VLPQLNSAKFLSRAALLPRDIGYA